MPLPYFLVFDGVDGAGKSTQIDRLRLVLEARGERVVVCRDPGSSELGERIRELLLRSTDVPISLEAEMLLYMAARAQLVNQVIRPALARGTTVISDRYLLANVVYQGHAGGLAPELIWQIGQTATGGLQPTLTIVLDLDPAVAAQRRQTPPDRLERRGREYFERVRAGYIAESRQRPDAIVVIDACQDPDTVHRAVLQAVRRAVSLEAEPHARKTDDVNHGVG
jgi:dTMP kinase